MSLDHLAMLGARFPSDGDTCCDCGPDPMEAGDSTGTGLDSFCGIGCKA